MDLDGLLYFFSDFVTDERKTKIEEVLAQRTEHFHVVVEDTYQEHNAGAIVRSCDCFGVQQLSVIENINEFNVSEGMSRGAEKWIDVNYHHGSESGIQNCIDQLRSKGYQIVATIPHPDAANMDNFNITNKSAFFFGREREGLSQQVVDQADTSLCIPMVGFTSSLNVSVSVAIVLQALTHKLRNEPTVNWRLTDRRNKLLRLNWYYNSIPNRQKMLVAYLKSHPEIERKELRKYLRF